MNFCVNFSDLTIEINSIYQYTYDFCKDYICNQSPDFSVETTEEKIDAEIASVDFNPPRGYAECICLYREIAEKLPTYNRCVFHGAVIEYEGRGFLFTAPSGTGKTTHIRPWKKCFGDKVNIVNGDKPILNIGNDGVVAYSTPYAGKEGYQNHSSVALCGICLIKRGEENRIERVNPGQYLTDIIKQIYMPFAPEQSIKTLELLDNILSKVPMYVLHCNISEEATITALEGMTKG